jgi:hypothetical protein
MWWPLYFIVIVAAAMGYTSQPLWVIPLLGTSWVAWRVKYYGTQGLSPARALGYVAFMWVIDSLQVGVCYGIGRGLKWLIA